jgi:hypothetical protein
MLERARTEDQRLPAPAPAAAKAAVSPSALILAGSGAVVGLVVGLPVVAAAAIGASFWGIRVGAGAALAAARRSRARRPEMIDPYAVPEPWRSFVRESLTAQAKFDQAVARSKPGPLHDRLGAVSVRVHDGTRECWRVAHLGAAVDADLAALNPQATSEELRRFQQDRAARQFRLAGSSKAPGVSGAGGATAGTGGATAGAGGATAGAGGTTDHGGDETEAALAARLQAARRMEAAVQRANDRLRVLTAQLHASVAGAVELSLGGDTAISPDELTGSVESAVTEIEALRRALEETSGGRTAPSPR